MTRRNTTILIYCFLLLLAAALIVFNRFGNPPKASPPEKSYAQKLAELKADLTQAAKAGPKKQPSTSNTRRKSTHRSSKPGST
jgi:hypothetical protein